MAKRHKGARLSHHSRGDRRSRLAPNSVLLVAVTLVLGRDIDILGEG